MDVKNIEDVSPSTAAQSSLLRSADGRAEAGELCGLWGCSLRGRLSEQAWRRAWREASQRHPLLRSAFVWKRVENSLRVVYREPLQAPTEQDWRGLSKEQQAERLKEHKRAERERGFNPAQPPLLRVFLCRTAEDAYQLLCSYSPLTLDEEALARLVAEVRARHESLLGAREASPEDERPFEEYLARRERSDYAGAERFWRLELEGLEAPTSLAGSTRESAEGESLGDDLRETQTELTELETETLLTRARNLGVSLGALAQGAWALLLANHTGQEDVTFGLAVKVAKVAQDEVGRASCRLPANTIPVRVPVPPYALAQSFLKAQESGMVERARHAFASPEQIRWWGGLPPGEPLFESRLVLREAARGTRRVSEGLYVEAAASFEFDSLPLSVEVTNDTRLALRIVFEAGRFDESAATRLLAHFRALLEGLASEPERPLWAVPMLTEHERVQVLAAWNDTPREYPRQQPIQQLFEAEATRAPDAVAVVSAEGELTYDTLNRRANQLAHYLRALGVGPEVAVALCVERSVEMIVALLGILKAGGAYVPLDPDYPLERLDFMLQDVAAPVLVTTSRLIERLPAHWGQVVSLDEDAGEIALESTENPPRLTGADNLAYVMYTSGSTGQPKGVGVVHRGVVRLVKSADYASLSPEEVVLQFAPLTFDASTFEIWGSLLNGARLVLMQPRAASLEEVGAALERYGVTTMWLTAGLFHLLVDEQPEQLSGLRQLLAGGDVLSAEHVRKALRSMRSGSLINGYGPTESTTFACCCPLTDESQFGSNVPIGRPISNTQVFLLDRHLRPVPPGATGELHIGGDGLARAYVNRPELTAERFIPNPFGREGGERLYKTGDLARHLPDGRIEFLGRSDFQVKVRGFRVELGEIETALGRHPSVRRCVVLARQDSPGEKQLAAYVVPQEGRELTPIELRRYLRNQLPDYMIPSQLVLLGALPLTPNGKVDRHALPAPVVARAADDSSFAEPTTPEERVLAEVWRQVLGLERVGVHDNFFDLGGDSIRSIQIRSQALRRGYEFSVQELFRHQTIAELAREMKPNGAGPQRSARTEPFSLISEEERLRLPSDVEDAYPLTQLQSGMIFHSTLETRTPLYHEVVSFHLRAPLDAGALGEALRRMASRHPVLRTSFDLNNFAEPLQLVHRDVTIPLALTDLGHLPHEEQERALAAWMEDEQRNTFASSQRPPLMRCSVFRRGAEEFQFTISFHHAIFDGWSMSTMLTELFSIYFSLLDPGRAHAELPPPTITLRDFVALEREALRSEEARGFWTEKLAGGVQTSLPESKETSPPESNGRHAAGEGKRTLSVQFGPELVEELRTLARCAAAPLKSVLLAAHLRALGLLCGQTEVVTGLVTNGRPEEADGERVLGLFLNTVPLTMVLGRGTWIDLVQAAYEAELEVSPYRRFPLTELQKGRGGHPIFETAFNYTHFHVTQKMREVADVEVLGMESFSRTSFPFSVSFDLNPATSGVVLFLEYDAARYGERQVEEVADSYRRVLTAMARDPFARHEHAPLLREEERHRLLYEWNDTGAPFAGEACLHELFEAQAARSPEAVAVIFEGQSATYAELNRRSNQLAHHLRSLGVGPETLVAVMMERCAELIVALLGVLKAGGAYVPLDPAYPRERLRFMLEDTRAGVLLTQTRLLEQAPATNDAQVLCLDADWWSREAGARPTEETDPTRAGRSENALYVLYTSGSTGQPKGVVVTHRGVVNCVEWMQRSYKLDSSDRFLFKTSLNFDASVWEIFWPLAVGASVVVARSGGEQDGAYLFDTMKTRGVTCAYFVPSLLTLWLDTPDVVSAPALRYVICGGEALPGTLLARFYERLGGGVGLHHSYGPTEVSIAASESVCSPEHAAWRQIPMGRALANTQLYVLDEHGEPTPRGVVGELYVGGEGVARGYLNQPALTAERFGPNPFSLEGGARLYRTGDMVRYLPDGQLEFAGRADEQLKVHGVRIEAGEIEAALRGHRGVSEAVVALREVSEGDARLVAYTVGVPDVEAGAAELRAYLKERLPEFMIPSAFVMLDKMPLLPSGKIDRRHLPEPELTREGVGQSYVAPRTEVEEAVAEIWAELLGVSQVGVHDNFFELGGHSILATRIISRVREKFALEVPLRGLFESPTVAGLSLAVVQQYVGQLDDEEREQMLAQLEELPEDAAQTLLSGQGGQEQN